MIPASVLEKYRKREELRKKGNYEAADIIRNELLALDYTITDLPNGTSELLKNLPIQINKSVNNMTIAVFGSGEMSSIGRCIHESLILHLKPPVKIALLETPAGYQDNPHHWYTRLKSKLEDGLANYKPEISLIPAIDKNSADNPQILAPLLNSDYIHAGAGSPSYAVNNLKNTLAIKYISERLLTGIPISVASATAIAFSKYALPVYELYFAGHNPYWMEGLNFFNRWNLNISFIPHWNNQEGGTDIDTRFAYMGEKRFNKLVNILPGPTTLIGIDEHTALIFTPLNQKISVSGKGTATVIKGSHKKIYKNGDYLSFEDLK
jgi:hypothetical protein